ncbi:unnamed protein product [Ectocarpus sp. 13 AM-2016]
MTAAPSSSPSWSSSSRTPSPSFRQGHEQQHFARQQQQQQSYQRAAAPISTSSPSPSWRRRSWNPPVVADDGRAAAAPSAAGGGGHHLQSGSKSKGLGKWDEEAQARASGSVGKQILQRYLTHLYPKASREVWSHDEEEVLWRAQKEYGNAWNYISSLLPGRSENAVKNHWYTQMRMFIGQRGNNPSSSKPCPPSSSRGAAAKTLGNKSSSWQQRRRSDDAKIDPTAMQQQQQQQQQCLPAIVPAPAEAEAAVATAATAAVATNTTIAAAKAEDVNEEKLARADAVAALGMLFTQGPSGRADAAAAAASSYPGAADGR